MAVPSLTRLAQEHLQQQLHPAAARFIDPAEPDAGVGLAMTVQRHMQGTPARGRTQFRSASGPWDRQPGVHPDRTAEEQAEEATDAIRRVNDVFTESTDGAWQLHLRLDSPVIAAFWLDVTWTEEHRAWIALHHGEPLQMPVRGRMAHHGGYLIASLDTESGRLRVDSRDCPAVWLEYTVPAQWLAALCSQPVAYRTRSHRA